MAHIGLTETEARRQGITVQVAKLPTASVLRTLTTGESQGFMKALIAPDDGRILGFTMVGVEAGEVMTVVQMAMQAGFPYTVLRESVLTHPTMVEGLNVLFLHRQTVESSFNQRRRKRPRVAEDFHAPRGGGWAQRLLSRAGRADAPVVLLLHGFPTSSFQFRELMPRLADPYRVIAPDPPGFGFTEIPAQRRYAYTFEALTQTMERFTDALNLTRYALYVFDLCASRGFRMAMAHPERVAAIVSQNGNAYEEGLGDAWGPFGATGARRARRIGRRFAKGSMGMACGEDALGIGDESLIAPEGYTVDAALMARPGNIDIQLDLFLDYANNVKLYPAFQ